EEILKYNAGGSAWECQEDSAAGSGSGGGLNLADILAEGSDGNAEDITNINDFESVTVSATKVGADSFCNKALDDCEDYADIRDVVYLQSTDIDPNLPSLTTTTGQVLIWDQSALEWTVGDGSD